MRWSFLEIIRQDLRVNEALGRSSGIYDIEFFEHIDSGTTKQLMSLGASTSGGGYSILDISGTNSTPPSIEVFSASDWPTLNGAQFAATTQEIFQLGGSNYVVHTNSSQDQILINDLDNPRQLEQVAFLGISSGDHLNGVQETAIFNSSNSVILMSASLVSDSVSFYKLSPDPSITSSTYDADTGQLVVAGDFPSNSAGSDIDISKLTVRGEGNSTYTLTSADVNRTTRSDFTITLNAADQLALAGILNNDGTTAGDGTTYAIEAAEDWSLGSDTADTIADTSGNTITVSNTPAPSITSATYDFSTGVTSVTGSNFPGKIGLNNDIDVSKLAITGDENGSYTLTTNDVDVNSSTTFTITLNTADRIAVSGLLNKDGTSSADSTSYNLLASDDWAAGAKSSSDIIDASNVITVSSYALLQVSSAEYFVNLGILKVFASNLPGELGPSNDIDTTKLVITGGSSADYTLTTANVEVTSRTEFTISLNDADKMLCHHY